MTTGSVAAWEQAHIDPNNPEIVGWRVDECPHCPRCANLRYMVALPYLAASGRCLPIMRSEAIAHPSVHCYLCFDPLWMEEENSSGS